jgi:hypothetical protein
METIGALLFVIAVFWIGSKEQKERIYGPKVYLSREQKKRLKQMRAADRKPK